MSDEPTKSRMPPFTALINKELRDGKYAGWKSDLLVWAVLRAHENKYHLSYPSYKQLQQCTGMQPRSLHASLDRLVERCVIERVEGKQKHRNIKPCGCYKMLTERQQKEAREKRDALLALGQ